MVSLQSCHCTKTFVDHLFEPLVTGHYPCNIRLSLYTRCHSAANPIYALDQSVCSLQSGRCFASKMSVVSQTIKPRIKSWRTSVRTRRLSRVFVFARSILVLQLKALKTRLNPLAHYRKGLEPTDELVFTRKPCHPMVAGQANTADTSIR